MHNWNKVIFSNDIPFQEKVVRVFKYQLEHNAVYKRYCEALGDINACHPKLLSGSLDDIAKTDIPLLPIRAFKDTELTAEADKEHDLTFKSSGTSNMQRSEHHVFDKALYEQSLLKGFNHFYDLESAVIWGYTPGYAENPHSSLIHMVQKLIEQDESGLSSFLPLGESLSETKVQEVEQSGKKLILFGAAFGLLDLLERKKIELPSNSIVIETGGMKTHRREMSRKELHRKLARGFGLNGSRIHSEYGMAELLSQSYATGGSWFNTVPWVSISIRNPDNPSEVLPPGREGLIGIIDLANVHSCSFLLTGDKGVMDEPGRFKVLGRWNPKDLRGCNFLIEED